MTNICSINVGLQLADDAPLQEVKRLYGGGDGLLTALQRCLSTWSGRVEPPDDLLSLLHHVRLYTALGGISVDDNFLRDMFSATLLDVVRRVVQLETCNNNSDEDNDAKETMSVMHQIITAASAAISNCCGGTTRHDANMLFWVKLPDEMVRLVFGFADYAEGETGARLWAGAVALSLYVIERLEDILHSVHVNKVDSAVRIIELGCGSGLLSLVLASCLTRRPELLRRTWLDVTDISPAVVEEVRLSFTLRNGPELAALFADDAKAEEGKVVRAFCLDFAAIPAAFYSKYDLVLGSDIVYDYTIAAYVAPALVQLLRPGGIAFICCEQHRDGMSSFVDTIRTTMAETLEIVENYEDVQTELQRLQMIPGLTATSCSLVVLRRRHCS